MIGHSSHVVCTSKKFDQQVQKDVKENIYVVRFPTEDLRNNLTLFDLFFSSDQTFMEWWEHLTANKSPLASSLLGLHFIADAFAPCVVDFHIPFAKMRRGLLLGKVALPSSQTVQRCMTCCVTHDADRLFRCYDCSVFYICLKCQLDKKVQEFHTRHCTTFRQTLGSIFRERQVVHLRTCALCPQKSQLKCSRCHLAYYCSLKCQKKDKYHHRHQCRKLTPSWRQRCGSNKSFFTKESWKSIKTRRIRKQKKKSTK